METSKRYSELLKLKTYRDRFNYLRLDGEVCEDTFGFSRYLNQAFYKSQEWKKVRRQVIIRDNGCDLGVEGYEINDGILIHHMNPISKEDLIDRNPDIFNPEYLICVTQKTHNAIHYGDDSLLLLDPVERKPNDTCPWR